MNHSKLVIKQQKNRLWYVGTGFSLLLLFIGAFVVGRYLAISDLNVTKAELTKSRQDLAETQATLDGVSESLVMQKQSAQVDNMSNQELVNSVKNMQQSKNELQEELKFYRNIMAPEREQKGLEIDSLLVSSTDKKQEFHFKVTLIQAGRQTQFLKGNVILRVMGLLNGKDQQYQFRELGTFNGKQFQFQFKYFQNIQGVISLPSGFDAKKVSVVAQTKGLRKNQKAEKQIAWQPEESQNYVRQ